ncbi:hypothetical protein ABB37_07820 [Leptomonas pyrrhocoris]|uniref:Uncharacterized protein n=1 Tax=Leptomonas pyrrhocoris TaxID=157538 RepID=A0A0M9FV57_LEPPY|nr:hypothetical protein ABB37_07820 [Leptomonas pyrrhocoris]KPA76526.1 hypothetical protein ABB37_07820 [Leptomonas pyrrhocoris]|eukprot:XP_015654965.1 hypothetical protein ABB37_07820 [Leptomonas pyrrhocoris]
MGLMGKPSALLFQRHFPPIRLSGRCFLLRPRHSPIAALSEHSSTSSANALLDLECVELTQDDSSSSRQQHAVPGSLVGNSYYTQRYKSGNANAGHRASLATSSSPRFFNGDLVLRLCQSAVPRELAHKRVVDVTGMRTSFLNSSERDRRALATVEEALQTMHLHDGHEVPALQRGDVDLMRLQLQCVYAPPSAATSRGAKPVGVSDTTSFDLRNVAAVLCPLDNPDVLLAQSRRLTFRSEMEALQVARVMAAAASALKGGPRSDASSSSSQVVLRPVVRDGHLISVVLRAPRRTR